VGYYSYYSLDVDTEDSSHLKEDIIADLINENTEAECALNADGQTINTAKWYESDNDMKLFSKKYPDVLFILFRYGQVLGDVGKSYFKNGRMKFCSANVSYPSFDVNKLEDYVPNSTEISSFENVSSCNFSIVLDCKNPSAKNNLLQNLRKSYTEANLALTEQGYFNENQEWPSHESNLVEFSKKYPKVRFTIYCEIDYEDKEINNMSSLKLFWRKDFLNGKIHRAKAFWEFEDFDDCDWLYGDSEGIEQDVTLVKSDWEIWMEKSKAARAQK
jgi:hypothetical protein